jgi:hypothetical protein
VVTVLISEERLVLCETRGGASAAALNFLVFFHVAAEGSMQRGGEGETEIGRGRRLHGERERLVAFFLFLLLLFRCNRMLSGKSDRLMKTKAFPGA